MLPPEEQAAAAEKAAEAGVAPEKKEGMPKIQADIVSDVDPKSGESGKKKKKKKKIQAKLVVEDPVEEKKVNP